MESDPFENAIGKMDEMFVGMSIGISAGVSDGASAGISCLLMAQ